MSVTCIGHANYLYISWPSPVLIMQVTCICYGRRLYWSCLFHNCVFASHKSGSDVTMETGLALARAYASTGEEGAEGERLHRSLLSPLIYCHHCYVADFVDAAVVGRCPPRAAMLTSVACKLFVISVELMYVVGDDILYTAVITQKSLLLPISVFAGG